MPVEFVGQTVLLIALMRLKDLKQILVIAFVMILATNVMLLAHMILILPQIVKIVVKTKIIVGAQHPEEEILLAELKKFRLVKIALILLGHPV
tara:strand:+ start:491 stop:769 length:279 start_codon:yes stop_codon:yes gene_type:complete